MRDEVGQEQPAFTYRVLRPSCGLAEKRTKPRTRTRLRTGKIVDDQNGFLTECRFHDRSQSGARLELIRAIELPNGLRMFEDGTGLLFAIRPVWGAATFWASFWRRLPTMSPACRSGGLTTRFHEPSRRAIASDR